MKIGYLGSGCVRVLFCFVFYLFFVFFFGLLLGDRRYGAGGPPSPLPMREPFVFFCKKIKKNKLLKKIRKFSPGSVIRVLFRFLFLKNVDHPRYPFFLFEVYFLTTGYLLGFTGFGLSFY